MISSKFKRCDLVRLKSGSPTMFVTAEASQHGMVSVALWCESSPTGLRGLTFRAEYLEKLDGEQKHS